jgi:hypothetical protein
VRLCARATDFEANIVALRQQHLLPHTTIPASVRTTRVSSERPPWQELTVPPQTHAPEFQIAFDAPFVAPATPQPVVLADVNAIDGDTPAATACTVPVLDIVPSTAGVIVVGYDTLFIFLLLFNK